MDNAWIKELCRCFGHMERMKNGRITKRRHVGECAGSHSVGRPQKRWIDTVKDCSKKRCLYVRQARRMEHDRIEWRGFVRENMWSVARGMKP